MSHQSSTLLSWPPSPTLLQTHLLTRSILLLTDAIGLSLLLAIGTSEYQTAAIVGGSFLTTSLSITPFIMLWNRKLLKRVTKTRTSHGSYKELDNGDGDVYRERFGVKILNVVTVLEGVAVLAFFACYVPLMVELTGEYRYWSGPQWAVIYSYGSVSVLISILLHSLLFTTQLAQLSSARRARKTKTLVCPNCNHTLTRTCSPGYTTPPESSMAAVQQHANDDGDMLGESLVDARISMSPGQETGTTVKTPRQSESQGRDRVANEEGEGEGDALIKRDG